MKRAEIVIIGGGIVGASVAYHLTERGAKDVLILERESSQGLGSTGKATGGVRAQFETEINILLSLYSIEFFNNWEFDCGYDPAGYLFFATDEDRLEQLKQNVRTQLRLGVSDVEIIDRDGIRKMIPGMNCDDILGGTFRARDGFIDPLAVMRGFTNGAMERGARIEFGASVQSINEKGGKLRSVTTSNGEIECDVAVLCAGAWAGEVAATAGIDLPIESLRRQIAWARSKCDLPARMPMVIDAGTGFHFRPAGGFSQGGSYPFDNSEGRDILFAFPDPGETPSFNTSFDRTFAEKVCEIARHRAAFLADCEVVIDKCRAGLYEVTPDHHAILGKCGVDNLYLAIGFSGHGVMHSPATGRAISEMILDGAARFLDVGSLGLDRFSKGTLIRETAFI